MTFLQLVPVERPASKPQLPSSLTTTATTYTSTPTSNGNRSDKPALNGFGAPATQGLIVDTPGHGFLKLTPDTDKTINPAKVSSAGAAQDECKGDKAAGGQEK